MNLRSRGKKRPLEMGSWLHKLLMVHCDGHDWREEHLRLTKKFKNLFEEEREELGNLPSDCGRIMRAYLRTYATDHKRYETVDTEMDEIVTLPSGLELNIIVDRVVWDRKLKGLWVWDYKSRKSFEDADNILLDPQGTRYFDGLEIMGYGPLLGFVMDEIRTKAPTVPDVLVKSGGLSKNKSIDTDVWTYMAEIHRLDLDPSEYSDILELIAAKQKDRFFRRTAIPKDPPVVKTMRRELIQSANEIRNAQRKNAFPRTPDKSCSWMCDYRDICIAQLYGGDIGPMIGQNFTTSRSSRRGDE